MQNPQKQIVDLLSKLIRRTIELNYQLNEIQIFHSYIMETKYLEIVNQTPTFFRVHNNSIQRDIIITLAKTFDPTSRRSIQKLIKWVKDNLKVINYKGVPITNNDIQIYLLSIDEIDQILEKIKIQRDKFIAHDDPIYFDQPYQINEGASVDLNELRAVLKVLWDVLVAINESINNAHYNINIAGVRQIDFVIQLLRHQKILFEDDNIRERMWNDELPYPVDT